MAREGRRARGRRTTTPAKSPWKHVLVGAAVAVVVAVVAFGALSGDEPPVPGRYNPVDEVAHVHGLGVHPEEADTLFVATHHGLIRGRLAGDEWEWALVGENADDFMGFSLHPRDGDVMWSSGHPERPTAEFHNLGVQKSTDGGFTWERIALEGVDFHAMTVSAADPDRLWGVYDGRAYHSRDGGFTWNVVNEDAPQVIALAAHPVDADTVYAMTPEGILESRDAGASWASFADVPAMDVEIAPSDAGTWYAAAGNDVVKSTDGGATWDATGLAAGARVIHVAVHPRDADVVYAVTLDAAIVRTPDGGASWSTLRGPAS